MLHNYINRYSLPVGSGRFVAMRKSGGVVLGGTLVVSDISHFYAADPNTLESQRFLACETLKSTENLRLVISNLEVTEELMNQPADFMGLDTVGRYSILFYRMLKTQHFYELYLTK